MSAGDSAEYRNHNAEWIPGKMMIYLEYSRYLIDRQQYDTATTALLADQQLDQSPALHPLLKEYPGSKTTELTETLGSNGGYEACDTATLRDCSEDWDKGLQHALRYHTSDSSAAKKNGCASAGTTMRRPS